MSTGSEEMTSRTTVQIKLAGVRTAEIAILLALGTGSGVDPDHAVRRSCAGLTWSPGAQVFRTSGSQVQGLSVWASVTVPSRPPSEEIGGTSCIRTAPGRGPA